MLPVIGKRLIIVFIIQQVLFIIPLYILIIKPIQIGQICIERRYICYISQQDPLRSYWRLNYNCYRPYTLYRIQAHSSVYKVITQLELVNEPQLTINNVYCGSVIKNYAIIQLIVRTCVIGSYLVYSEDTIIIFLLTSVWVLYGFLLQSFFA